MALGTTYFMLIRQGSTVKNNSNICARIKGLFKMIPYFRVPREFVECS